MFFSRLNMFRKGMRDGGSKPPPYGFCHSRDRPTNPNFALCHLHFALKKRLKISASFCFRDYNTYQILRGEVSLKALCIPLSLS